MLRLWLRLSHLLQMRGLKPFEPNTILTHFVSHLLQMRGLKLPLGAWNRYPKQSHLLQMRGLKQYIQPGPSLTEVASFTDAWIETTGSKV